MKFEPSPISGVFVITPLPFEDERGWFSRMFCKKEFREVGLDSEFVQLNQSFNRVKGTFRGMHYQAPPFAEKKLVRCVTGGIIDYVVDLRKGSPTFLKSFGVELSSENKKMIFIPEGIAHGFISTEDNTSLMYHHTAYHNPPSEQGLRFNDPRTNLEISRPIIVISERDKGYPLLASDFVGLINCKPFTYGGAPSI